MRDGLIYRENLWYNRFSRRAINKYLMTRHENCLGVERFVIAVELKVVT